MSLKPGVLVMCKGGTPNLAHRKFAGTIHRIGHCVCIDYLGEHWRLEPPTIVGKSNLQWTKHYLRIIGDPTSEDKDESLAYLPPVPITIKERETA